MRSLLDSSMLLFPHIAWGNGIGISAGIIKQKATAGNRASTFRQQPFVFPSAPHPVGGINAAVPLGTAPACAIAKRFPLHIWKSVCWLLSLLCFPSAPPPCPWAFNPLVCQRSHSPACPKSYLLACIVAFFLGAFSFFTSAPQPCPWAFTFFQKPSP